MIALHFNINGINIYMNKKGVDLGKEGKEKGRRCRSIQT
jgi:hypothetical protein